MSFALYLDENVPFLLADLLTQLGHDVLTTQGARRRGAPDEDQLAFAAANRRAILTHDRDDYKRLAIAWADSGKDHYGIVTVRNADPFVLRRWVVRLFELYPDGIVNLYLNLPLAD